MIKEQSFLSKHPILKTLLIMFGISLGIVLVMLLVLSIITRHGKEYELPDLVNTNLSDLGASNPLALDPVVVDSIYREGVDGGLVLLQSPKAGTKIKRGRKVYVTVSRFMPNDAVVPDIVGGINVKTAISQLNAVGLKGGKLKFVESPYRNIVINATYGGRNVEPGQRLVGGAAIDLIVGLGDDQSLAVEKVPFVIGKKSDRARFEILSASMNVGIEHFENVTDRFNAVVCKQVPAYNGVTKHHFGTYVELWYRDANQQEIDQMVKNYNPEDYIQEAVNSYLEEDLSEPFEDEGFGDW